MLQLVTVCRPAGAFDFYSGHPDVCTAIIIIFIEGDQLAKAVFSGALMIFICRDKMAYS